VSFFSHFCKNIKDLQKEKLMQRRQLRPENANIKRKIDGVLDYIRDENFDGQGFEIGTEESDGEGFEIDGQGFEIGYDENKKTYEESNENLIADFLNSHNVEESKKMARKISPRKNGKDELLKHLQWLKNSKEEFYERSKKEGDKRRNVRVEGRGQSVAEIDDDGQKNGWAHSTELLFLKKELLFGLGANKEELKEFEKSLDLKNKDPESEYSFEDKKIHLCPKHVCVICCIIYITKAVEETIAWCFATNRNPVITVEHMKVLGNRRIRIDDWIDRIDRMKFFQYILASATMFNTTFKKYKKELQKKFKVMEWNIQSLKKRQSNHYGADFGLDPNPNSKELSETINSILSAYDHFEGGEGQSFEIENSACETIMQLTKSYITGLCEDAMTFHENSIGRISGAMIRSMADVHNPRNPSSEEHLIVKSNIVCGKGTGETLRLPENGTNARNIALNVQKIRGYGIQSTTPLHPAPDPARAPENYSGSENPKGKTQREKPK
jgi:hypothetical protein